MFMYFMEQHAGKQGGSFRNLEPFVQNRQMLLCEKKKKKQKNYGVAHLSKTHNRASTWEIDNAVNGHKHYFSTIYLFIFGFIETLHVVYLTKE